jgi:hypothetical protein
MNGSTSLDRNKNPIALGDDVRIFRVPADLPSGLPNEDQAAIHEQLGKVLVVQGFGEAGSVELEFVDSKGHPHTIWIDPTCLERVGRGSV